MVPFPEIPFLGKFGPNNQNCQFKLKFGTKTNSNKQNLMVLFTFSIFNKKYPFGANLVEKIKIVSSIFIRTHHIRLANLKIIKQSTLFQYIKIH